MRTVRPSVRGLIEVLNDIACGRSDPDELTRRLRQALLDFGSQTPDNVACAQVIEVGDTEQHRGIKLRGHAMNLADLAWGLEHLELPAKIQ